MIITLGGLDKELRPLTIEESEAWRERVAREVLALLSAEIGLDLLGRVNTAVLDALLAYDVDSTIGTGEWIRSHATPAELWEAGKTVAQNEFGWTSDVGDAFGADARAKVLQGLLAAAMRPAVQPAAHRDEPDVSPAAEPDKPAAPSAIAEA